MRLSYVDMAAGVLCLGLMGLVLFLVIDALHGRLCRWQGVLGEKGEGAVGQREP